jgi:hypothetical protein
MARDRVAVPDHDRPEDARRCGQLAPGCWLVIRSTNEAALHTTSYEALIPTNQVLQYLDNALGPELGAYLDQKTDLDGAP